jgi:hypothetical protein
MEVLVEVTQGHRHQLGYQRFNDLELKDYQLSMNCRLASPEVGAGADVSVRIWLRGIDTIATLRQDIDHLKDRLPSEETHD